MDADYIQGLEDGINMVKHIFELTVGERKEYFGTSDVASILDKFDFSQLREKMHRISMKKLVADYAPTPLA